MDFHPDHDDFFRPVDERLGARPVRVSDDFEARLLARLRAEVDRVDRRIETGLTASAPGGSADFRDRLAGRIVEERRWRLIRFVSPVVAAAACAAVALLPVLKSSVDLDGRLDRQIAADTQLRELVALPAEVPGVAEAEVLDALGAVVLSNENLFEI